MIARRLDMLDMGWPVVMDGLCLAVEDDLPFAKDADPHGHAWLLRGGIEAGVIDLKPYRNMIPSARGEEPYRP